MTTTDADPVFIDTNILVYAHLAASPWHERATRRLQELYASGVALWVSRQVMREYVATMTRPGAHTGMIPIATLAADVRSFATLFQVAEDNAEVTDRLVRLLTAIPAAGRQVHDANIVATMQTYAIPRLLTHNVADFARYGALIQIEPLV